MKQLASLIVALFVAAIIIVLGPFSDAVAGSILIAHGATELQLDKISESFEKKGVQDWSYGDFTESFTRSLSKGDPRAVAFLVLMLGLLGGLVYYIYIKPPSLRIRGYNIPAESQSGRAWVRVRSDIDCDYQVISGAYADGKTHKVKVRDLGGGGCLLAASHKLDVKDNIIISLDLGEKGIMNIKGEVVRLVAENEDDPQGTYLMGIKFVGLREGERDRLMQWIFKHERDIHEEKRRLVEGLCLNCGRPLAEEAIGKTLYCVKCSTYKES